MEVIDILFVVILSGFILGGLKQGLIRSIGSFAGLIFGLYISVFCTGWLALQSDFFSGIIVKVIVFIVILSLVTSVISILVSIVDKAFNLLAIIPFIKPINKLLGGIFGFLEGSVILVAISFLGQVILQQGALREAILASRVVQLLSWTTELIVWIFPQIPIN